MNSDFSQVGILNESSARINPSTEEKQDALLAQQGGLAGTSTAGQSVLTGANTWVQVPTTIPTEDYLLTFTTEIKTGVIRWSFSNASTPSATNGQLVLGPISILLAGGQAVYVGSTVATDAVNWSAKEVL